MSDRWVVPLYTGLQSVTHLFPPGGAVVEHAQCLALQALWEPTMKDPPRGEGGFLHRVPTL